MVRLACPLARSPTLSPSALPPSVPFPAPSSQTLLPCPLLVGSAKATPRTNGRRDATATTCSPLPLRCIAHPTLTAAAANDCPRNPHAADCHTAVCPSACDPATCSASCCCEYRACPFVRPPLPHPLPLAPVPNAPPWYTARPGHGLAWAATQNRAKPPGGEDANTCVCTLSQPVAATRMPSSALGCSRMPANALFHRHRRPTTDDRQTTDDSHRRQTSRARHLHRPALILDVLGEAVAGAGLSTADYSAPLQSNNRPPDSLSQLTPGPMPLFESKKPRLCSHLRCCMFSMWECKTPKLAKWP